MDTKQDIKGQSYSFSKLLPLKQFHIVRRLSPMLGELAPLIKDKMSGNDIDPIAILPALSKVLSEMTDENADFILFGLLAAVSRKQTVGYAPVTNSDTNSLMFTDIDLPLMMELAGRSLMFNLGNFFDALPSNSTGMVPKPKVDAGSNG